MRYVILLCLAGAAISLSACGGTSSTNTGAGSTSPQDTAASNSKALQFAQCMRSHGVPNFPDPSAPSRPDRPSGPEEPEPRPARGQRSSGEGAGVPVGDEELPIVPSERRVSDDGSDGHGEVSGARGWRAACVRTVFRTSSILQPQAVPGRGGGPRRQEIGGPGIDPDSPAFQTAQKDCGSIFGGAPTVAKAPG